MRNLRLDICYDGTRYRGWQRLPGREDTIQGKLETALSRILGEPIEISGSGRTDAGVHAMCYVANFRTTSLSSACIAKVCPLPSWVNTSMAFSKTASSLSMTKNASTGHSFSME